MSDEPLGDFPVVVRQDVQWGEMDYYRHVNNAVYFRYFETARLEYVLRLGWPDHEAATGVGIILQAIQARFRRPLSWPDTIRIGVRLGTLGEDRFTLDHSIYSEGQQAIVTEGHSTVVVYDYRNNRKAPVPEEMRGRIEELERTRR